MGQIKFTLNEEHLWANHSFWVSESEIEVPVETHIEPYCASWDYYCLNVNHTFAWLKLKKLKSKFNIHKGGKIHIMIDPTSSEKT